MSKQEFLELLRKGLSGLPQDDIEERLTFYSEMIEDSKEEGLLEEEAVAAIGPVEKIVAQIVAETPLAKIAKERIRPKRRLGVGEIVLLVLGAPIWLSLGIAAFAVIISLYASLWTVIICLWSVFASLVAFLFGSGVVFTVGGNIVLRVAILGAGIVFAGLSIFMFYGCKAATKGIFILTRKIAIWIKNCFFKRETA